MSNINYNLTLHNKVLIFEKINNVRDNVIPQFKFQNIIIVKEIISKIKFLKTTQIHIQKPIPQLHKQIKKTNIIYLKKLKTKNFGLGQPGYQLTLTVKLGISVNIKSTQSTQQILPRVSLVLTTFTLFKDSFKNLRISAII